MAALAPLSSRNRSAPRISPDARSGPSADASAGGQSLVEFALVLPVLLLILSGAIDLARVYTAQVTITNAAREGARYGAANHIKESGIKQAALDEASNSGVAISAGDVSVNCFRLADDSPFASCLDGGIVAGEAFIQVTVAHPFPLITGGILGFGNLMLSNSATMVITD